MSLKMRSFPPSSPAAVRRRARRSKFGEVVQVHVDPSQAGGNSADMRKLRVLVAEDQSRVRDIAVNALSRNGMIVRKTSRPDHLLSAVRRFKPHVVVLDDHFTRSGTDFSSLVPALKERFPGVRVIVTSDMKRATATYSADPVNRGAWDVVSKSGMQNQKGQDALVKSVRSAVEAI